MKTTMRAAVYYSNSDIRLEERPIPEIADDEILVKTIACGMCGGEAMEWYHIKRAPKVMGHEPAGIVARKGRKVEGVEEGDRVFVNHHAPRLNSHQSLRGHFTKDEGYKKSELVPGAMCEFFRVSAAHIENAMYRLPEGIGFDAATILEPWGCVLGGLKVSGIQIGDTVAVVGCGFMGQGFVHLSRALGAGLVFACDLSDWRLAKSLEFGASHSLNPRTEDIRQKLMDLNGGRKADAVIVTVPNVKALEQALLMVEVGGTIHINAPPPPEQVWRLVPAEAYDKEISITTKYSADHRDIYQLFRLMGAKRIDPLRAITHRFELEDVRRAFDLLLKGDESLKSVIYPHGLGAVE